MGQQCRKLIYSCRDFSKWPEMYTIPNQEANTVVNSFMNNWNCRYDVPVEIHFDQGKKFDSIVFKDKCRVYGIKKTRTTHLHPQSDEMAERFNRFLEIYLRKVVSEVSTNMLICCPWWNIYITRQYYFYDWYKTAGWLRVWC